MCISLFKPAISGLTGCQQFLHVGDKKGLWLVEGVFYIQISLSLSIQNIHFALLLIDRTYQQYFSRGINTSSYLLSLNLWVVSTCRVLKHYLSKCNQHLRCNPTSAISQMGNLPNACESQSSNPFSCAGVDFPDLFPTTTRSF